MIVRTRLSQHEKVADRSEKNRQFVKTIHTLYVLLHPFPKKCVTTSIRKHGRPVNAVSIKKYKRGVSFVRNLV